MKRSRHAAIVAVVFALAACGGSAGRPDGGGDNDAGARSLPAVPLHTTSRWVMDANNTRFKLAGVNWYGAESAELVPDGLRYRDVNAIARSIRELGFNSVRLPWCNELVERNPIVASEIISANPALEGKTALEVLDVVVEALAREGLVVILDNHRSRGDWCCDTAHGDGLWYTAEYPEEKWIAHWEEMARRYLDQPAVVGADLRNELRGQLAPTAFATCTDCDQPTADCVCEWASWGDTTGNNRDWTAAAERAGNAILAINPSWLIVVEGPHWASWLGASYRPIRLAVAERVVYSVHNYQMMGAWQGDCAAFKMGLDGNWGNIVKVGTGPVWLGEFGVNHDTGGANPWWACLREYMTELDVDWAYWAVNGTQGPGYGRTLGAAETYGVLDPTWTMPGNPEHVAHLQALIPATQGPPAP